MLNFEQKKLILELLRKEQRSLFSKYKGRLLEKTLQDVAQMVRNEEINGKDRRTPL
jgi:hypothetical protein